MNLTAQVPSFPDRRGSHRLREALGGAECLLERLRPITVQPQQLGAMHQAAPPEGHQARLLLAPPSESSRPLLSAAYFVDVFASENDAAVHDAGHDRRYLACSYRHHRLVQQA